MSSLQSITTFTHAPSVVKRHILLTIMADRLSNYCVKSIRPLGSKHGQEVADQLIEISLRVDTVRPYAVDSMLSMLLTDALILGQARQTVSEVRYSSLLLYFRVFCYGISLNLNQSSWQTSRFFVTLSLILHAHLKL